MALTEKQQACRDEQNRLKGLYDLFDDAQRADFIRRWDIVNALPNGLLPLQKDIRGIESTSKANAALANKLIIGLVVGGLGLCALNFLLGNGFAVPDWSSWAFYVGFAVLFFNGAVLAVFNKQMLIQIHRARDTFIYEGGTAGLSPYTVIRLAELLSLKDNEFEVPLPEDYPEKLLEMSNQITQQILDAVLREPKNLYFDWVSNY